MNDNQLPETISKFEMFKIAIERIIQTKYNDSEKFLEFIYECMYLIILNMNSDEKDLVHKHLEDIGMIDDDGNFRPYIVKGYMPINPKDGSPGLTLDENISIEDIKSSIENAKEIRIEENDVINKSHNQDKNNKWDNILDELTDKD